MYHVFPVVEQTGMLLYLDPRCLEHPETTQMVTITLRCPFCDREALLKYGLTPNGKQRDRCRDCGRQHRADPAPNGYTPEQREVILRAYQERSRLRRLSRTFGVSRTTVSRWLKKSPEFGAVGHNAAAGRTRRGAPTR